ncbi:acetyl-CoA C-acetyltransferase [Patulibacter defluvii]|uniref:acetyl-CoA C-acetyltransferase n=1 Tax=Patulibacter defluvii TaxID=3095358 RepID=UPI002A761005|nr:acetyl-CoA C-acetyltransferase [Patulibacter sp. DM4]
MAPPAPSSRERPLRPVAILGGNRIPFARSNAEYLEATNEQMLSAALEGLIERFGLEGQRLGEVAGGAVVKLARDHSLTREAVVGSALDRRTPAFDVQQQCATGGQTVVQVANKIAVGQIASGIACGADTTSDPPIGFGRRLRGRLVRINAARSTGDRARELLRFRPTDLDLDIPSPAERRTGLPPGEGQARTGAAWGITREAQDELALASHRNLAAAYDRGFLADLVTPFRGLREDGNLRREIDPVRLAALKPCFGGPEGTMTAANSTTLTDGASAVLLADERWADEHGHEPLAWLVDAQSAAVDYVDGPVREEGVLMAPAYAVSELLERNGLALQDFDLYEIHEAFASQVLTTLAAWEDPQFNRTRLGRKVPLGPIDRSRLNVNGGSLATGHPFGATGGRIVAAAAKALTERGGGRALVSICAGSGMGVVMVLER